MNRILIFLVIIVSFSIQAQTTYYVDASNGNDSNNGTTTTSAWKSISKLNKTTFKPGDHILFKRGEIWTMSTNFVPQGNGTPSNYITIGAYGTGAKPIFRGGGKQLTLNDRNYYKIQNIHLTGSSLSSY